MHNEIVRYPTPLTAPLSRAVRAGGFLFLSGQTPKDENLQPLRGDIKTQTRNVLNAISESLKTCDSNLSEVVRVTVWLSDISLMGDFNEVYREYFGAALPTRSTVQAKLANGVDIEVEVQAWSPQA